jgi:hypothetical protein
LQNPAHNLEGPETANEIMKEQRMKHFKTSNALIAMKNAGVSPKVINTVVLAGGNRSSHSAQE